ncbi:MAG: 4a-hydroxytetrahydrobiopterin dehydratase [Anaerolineales bacterium]|nr:4a-hydroxytetrahydrobiopterin dehydratase [Anaerolineales bacterium]
MALLTPAQIEQALDQLPGWSVQAGKLTKEFTVRSFAHAVVFVGAIAQLAEAMNHHPDLYLHDYKQVTISLIDHHAGGLSEKDAALAIQIEALPHKKPDPEKKA